MAYCIGSGRAPVGVSAVYQLVLPKARIHQVLEELHSSPSGGHFGVTRTLARKKIRNDLCPNLWKTCERLNRIHRFASEKLKMHSDKMKQRLDTTSTEIAFKPGDAVWLYAPKRTKGKSPKLQSNWEGPYTIIKKINDLVYRIQLSQEASRRWSIWRDSQGIQDIIHPTGLSSRIHRLGLKTVLFGTNNLKEGSNVTFVKVTFVTADIY
ncbi:hypothetical protein NQ318_002541 [Aromia moschata]|uniref:RNA-directed DNA polymerase n=1 Tax=Aromia moschata TaxID=1265417 RepID=A0AAV8X4P4_9CUCU|nr:hypothetical protein NQ318_002541 [Aromia moschata]